MAQRKTKTTCVFCKTSHGKSKSDGLGGAVKSFASRAIFGEGLIICDAKELFEFFETNLTLKDVLDNDKPMLNRHFFDISKEEMESYRAAFPSQSYQSIKGIKGTLAIHQVVIATPGSSNTIQYRNSSCACSACFNGEYTKYECLQLYKDYPKPFQMIKHNFSIWNKSRTANDDDDESFMDLNEDEVIKWQEETFVETEAAKFIVKGDIAVI